MMTQDFVQELKTLILAACDKDEPADGLAPDEALFGPESRLGLDSLDFIELSIAIEERFGIVIDESEDLARHFHSLDALSRFICAKTNRA